MRNRIGVFLVGGVGISGIAMAAAERITVFTAMLAFVGIIEICRGCSVRFYNRGYQLHTRKNYKEAFVYYSKAISVNPLLVRAYSNRGAIRAEWKEYDLALADYTKAIQIQPRKSNAYFNRGIVFAEKNDCKRAIADFDKAIGLNSQYTEAYLEKAEIFESQALKRAAVDVYRALLKDVAVDDSVIAKANERIVELELDS